MNKVSKTSEINGKTYTVKYKADLDSRSLLTNVYSIYENDVLLTEKTQMIGFREQEKSFQHKYSDGSDATKLVVIAILENGVVVEIKTLKNEKALKKQWFYGEQDMEIITLK